MSACHAGRGVDTERERGSQRSNVEERQQNKKFQEEMTHREREGERERVTTLHLLRRVSLMSSGSYLWRGDIDLNTARLMS